MALDISLRQHWIQAPFKFQLTGRINDMEKDILSFYEFAFVKLNHDD